MAPLVSTSVTTRNCQGWMLPPLGACTAARRHVRSSSSVTASSVKRRMARVVRIASCTSTVGPSASAELGGSPLSHGAQRLLMVVAEEREQLERGRGVERDVQRVLHQLVDRDLRVPHGQG